MTGAAAKAFPAGEADAYFSLPFGKVVQNDDGTVTVHGMPSTETVDLDGQIVDREFMRRALPRWMEWGNVREMHQPKAIGRAHDLSWDEDGRPWITAHIVDPDAVKKVKSKVLQAFSVGVKHPRFRHDPNAPRGRMVDGEVLEVSAVDRPADPDCRFEIVKAAGAGEWLDCQSGFVVKDGDVQPWDAGNSVDFDSMGNPVLQPGHVRSDDAEISVVAMDDRGVVVRVGQEDWVVPYRLDSRGSYVFGDPEPLPRDPKATTGDPRASKVAVEREDDTGLVLSVGGARYWVPKAPDDEGGGAVASTVEEEIRAAAAAKFAATGAADRARDMHVVARTHDSAIVERWREGRFYRFPLAKKGAGVELGEPEAVEEPFSAMDPSDPAARDLISARRAAMADLAKAAWTTAYVDTLPDSAFAYVEPGGKIVDGRTEPRSLRHLPYKGEDGKPDPAHVRNALARLDQTQIPESAKAEARRKLVAAAKEVGIEVSDARSEKAAEVLRAAEKAVKSRAYCPECRKETNLKERLSEEDGRGGVHATYKGECGHIVHKFEPREAKEPAEAKAVEETAKAAESRRADEARCETCKKKVAVREHRPEHRGCVGECGHAVKCEMKDGAEKGAATAPSVPSGMGRGVEPGAHNGEGQAPALRIESQQRDIAGRMQAAVQRYTGAVAQGSQSMQNRALADLRSLTSAAVAQEEQDAVSKAAQLLIGRGDYQAASVLLATVGKAGRKIKRERLERLKEHHRRLGELIGELDDEPEEGDGAEEGAKGAHAHNDGAAPAVTRKDVAERIREAVAEIDRLAREVEAGEEGLIHDETATDPRLGGDPDAPDRKPGGETWDLRRRDGAGAAIRDAGEDAGEMHKTVAAEVAKAAGSEIARLIGPLMDRVEAISHQPLGVTRADIYVAERPEEFGLARPEVRKAAVDGVRERIGSMSPDEQRAFAQRLVQEARRSQR